MNTEMAFDVPIVKKSGSKLSAQAMKAIHWYTEHYNLRAELSTPPQIYFTSKELGETYPILLTDVVEEYKKYRKEELKEKARLKKLHKGIL